MSRTSYVAGRQNSRISCYYSDWLKVSLIMQKLLVFIPSNQDLQHISHRDLMYTAGYWQIIVEVSAALEILILQFCWTVPFFFFFSGKM